MTSTNRNLMVTSQRALSELMRRIERSDPHSGCYLNRDRDEDSSNATILFRRFDLSQNELTHRLCERLDAAFATSKYPLRQIRSEMDGDSVALSGCVTRYFHMQMAIEITRRVACGRQVLLKIEVVADDFRGSPDME
jgi:hypothetical protein